MVVGCRGGVNINPRHLMMPEVLRIPLLHPFALDVIAWVNFYPVCLQASICGVALGTTSPVEWAEMGVDVLSHSCHHCITGPLSFFLLPIFSLPFYTGSNRCWHWVGMGQPCHQQGICYGRGISLSILSFPVIDYPTKKYSTILGSCTKFTSFCHIYQPPIFTGPASALRHHPL